MIEPVSAAWWKLDSDVEEVKVEVAPIKIHIRRGDGTKAEKIAKRFLNEYCNSQYTNANWRNGYYRNSKAIDLTDSSNQFRNVQVKLCTKGCWVPGRPKNIETVLQSILDVDPSAAIMLIDVEEKSRLFKRACIALASDCYRFRHSETGKLRCNLSTSWLTKIAGGHYVYDITGYELISTPATFTEYLKK